MNPYSYCERVFVHTYNLVTVMPNDGVSKYDAKITRGVIGMGRASVGQELSYGKERRIDLF